MTTDGAFRSLYHHGFVRVAATALPVHLVDPGANAAEIITSAQSLAGEGAALVVYPELALTGYTADDLFLSDALRDAVAQALETIVKASADLMPVLVVGAPLQHLNRLYNCAVVIHRGLVLGVVPKSYPPTYREFYEGRHFAAGVGISDVIEVAGQTTEFGQCIFEAADVPGFKFHVEICEDMWVPVPPHARAALAGASVLVNLSASPVTIRRADDRHLMSRSASTRCLAAYVYAAAGAGESTTDLAFDGHAFIYENGNLLAESSRFGQPQPAIADVDLDALRLARAQQGTFDDNATFMDSAFTTVTFELGAADADLGLRHPLDRFPFVPDDPTQLDRDCFEGYNIQVAALVSRLRAIGKPKIVLGVSGGLDSTHALLVAARAMDELGRPRSDVLTYTMPGFATTAHTRTNAEKLATSLGCSFETIDIRPAAEQMLRDLGHPYSEGKHTYDVTFENVQAGLRTDYLFRIANHKGGIVLGTGDLSELALGWCTYGVGDQMSHYGVNAGVPKTLMQHLIRWVVAKKLFGDETSAVLESILATEITPELVPTRVGEVPQSTQANIGPYELQDFHLYYLLRGMRPSKIAFLAHHAWADAAAGSWPIGLEKRNEYDLATIKKWLGVLLRRFVQNQFKRSALPNGPKVSRGGALSPRGDWRMPADASPKIWLEELARVPDSW